MDGEISLGALVKDSLTDFQGTVTARCTYLHDRTQLLVQARLLNESGEAPTQWLAESRVSVIGC